MGHRPQYQPGGHPLTTNSTTGGWVETVAPGILIKINPASMPHALVSEGGGAFTFKRLSWDQREVGDDKSCPLPSFIGRQLEDVFFARNRLGFLSGDNVCLSRAGGLYYNFFSEKASQVLDTDQIDIAATDKELSLFNFAMPFAEDILLFSDKAQHRLTSGQDLMTPKTVELKPVSTYPRYNGVSPVTTGSTVVWVTDSGANSLVTEFNLSQGKPTAVDITEHVPRYLPPKMTRLVWCHQERTGLALSETTPNAVWVYNYYTRGDDRLQSEWSVWRWGAEDTILDIGVIQSDLVLVIQRPDGLHLEKVSLTSGRNDGGADHVMHLDRRITEARCTLTYEPSNGVTVVTLPYANTGGLQVWERLPSGTKRLPKRIHSIRRGTNQLVLSGNRTADHFFVGAASDSLYEFSEQFLRQDNVARTDGRLQLRRFRTNHGRTAAYAADVYDPTRAVFAAVDLVADRDRAYAFLQSLDANPIETDGVTLTLDEEYDYSHAGAVSGATTGVRADGRYVLRLETPEAVYEAPIESDGIFEFPESDVGIKTVSIVQLRDGAIIAQRVLGLTDPAGRLLVSPGVFLSVAPGVPVPIEMAPSGSDLLAEDGICSTLVQAISSVAAIAAGDTGQAVRWLRVLVKSQLETGGFTSNIDPTTGEGTGNEDLETNLWVLLALAIAPGFETEMVALEEALDGFLEDGLYGNSGSPSAYLNILAYFALKAGGYDTVAFAENIVEAFWSEDHGCLLSLAGASPGDHSVPLGAAFLKAIGEDEKAAMHSLWQPYFQTTAGSAKGIASTVPGLFGQGDYTKAPPSVDLERTMQLAISAAAMGDRVQAKSLLANVETMPLTGLTAAWRVIAFDPETAFGITQAPLNAEGPVTVDRTPYFTYRFLGDTPAEDGRFDWPVDIRSENAKIRLRSVGALPFGVQSAEWEGFFTTRDQKA